MSFAGEAVVLVKGVQVCRLELGWKGGTVVLGEHGHFWRPDGTRRIQSLLGGRERRTAWPGVSHFESMYKSTALKTPFPE